MSVSNNILSVNTSRPLKESEKIKVAILTATWHEAITGVLSEGAESKLIELGILSDNILRIAVPGAFELPQAANMVLKYKNVDAIICLGCVIKGETQHDEFINHAIANGLTNLSIQSGKPVILGVLTTLNYQQALDRADGSKGKKGEECAVAAVNMLIVKQSLVQ
ncbi:MAG: 6,7-dimethyl-8-ribityllumazine synthase [Saprospiraceae bacterium]